MEKIKVLTVSSANIDFVMNIEKIPQSGQHFLITEVTDIFLVAKEQIHLLRFQDWERNRFSAQVLAKTQMRKFYVPYI